MDVVSYLLNRPVETPKAQETKLTEESLVSAISSFFTENINYLITATLVYFTLFAGFTRMKQKHLMVAVPTAAIWTVLQAKALVGTLAAGTAVLGLAKAYFAWQGTSASTQPASDLADMAQRFTRESGGVQGVGQVLADQVLRRPTTHKPSSPSRLHEVAHSVMSQVGGRQAAPPSLPGTRTTSLFGTVDQAVEDYQAFDMPSHSPSLLTSEKLDLGSAPSLDGLPDTGFDSYLDGLLDEFDEVPPSPVRVEHQGFDASETLGQLREAMPDTTRLSREQVREFEGVLNEVSSQRISPQTEAMFEGIWQQGLQQAPKGANTEDWATEFLVRESKKKGMSFGQIAKWCVGLALAGLTLYSLYKLWTAESEEAETEDKVHDLDRTQDFEEYDEESSWMGSFFNTLSYMAPESDGYGSDEDGLHMFGGGMFRDL